MDCLKYFQWIKHRYFLGFILLSSIFTSCQESFDERLCREAKEFTKNHCPQEPEKGTRLDSTTYNIQSRTYTQWYSLETLNEQILSNNMPLLKQALLKRLIADVNYKALKDEDITFRYVYYSQNNGRIVYQTSITAKEYKQSK